MSLPQSVTLPLDLDLEDFGQTPIAWTEGFETGTLGTFEPENLDAGLAGNNNIEGLLNSDGWRCQFSDPDWPNSNSYGNDTALDCYPTFSLAHGAAIYWQVDGVGTGAPDGGRAKSGNFSMYYGIYLAAESDFTTPMATVESVRTTAPINLGKFSPEMSWWQQISLVDGRFLSIPTNRAMDRGVVQIKTVNAAGEDTSFWIRLEPYKNSFDTQAYDFYFNCKFDPVDDGTTEDDFFDPTDPARRLGPSSTCHPMVTYSCQGDTDEPFQVDNICNATSPPTPADAPDFGIGTWVESRIDLSEYRGQRVKLRFLVSTLKASSETQDGQFDSVNPGEWDNGWWIDDITIDETLTNPAQLLVDTHTVRHCAGDEGVGCLGVEDCVAAGVTGPCEGQAPQCGPTCTTVTAVVATTPDATGGALDETLAAPGLPIELDASDSFGQCLDGTLQYRFALDGGAELRPWSENALFVDAPQQATDYRVDVRCSTDTTCTGSAVVGVAVDCPTTGSLAGPFPETILAPDKASFAWTTPLDYDLFSGGLSDVASYAGTLASGSGNGFPATAEPPAGAGFYYLVREAGEFCNDAGLWTSAGPGEAPGRETGLP